MTIDLVSLVQNLISFPSVTPNDFGAIDYLSTVLKEHNFNCQILEFGDNDVKIKNLYARLGNKPPNLCFAGHTDVVPPGDLDKWDSDPFSPEIRDGILYGRGAVDMKASVCAFIVAVSELLDKDIQGSISLLITGDEEGPNSQYGTKSVLDWLQGKDEKIHYCLVGEPTSRKEIGDYISIGRRGSINFTLKCHGLQEHVAIFQSTEHAIDNMISILHKINSTRLDEGSKDFPPSNCVITTIDVGNQTSNVIPGLAVAKFNIRFNDLHTSETLIALVNEICSGVTNQYELSYTLSGEVSYNQPDWQTDILVNAVKKITGKGPEFTTGGGTSDARFIRKVCPTNELGLLGGTAHKINECTSVEDIKTLTDIYKLFIKEFFNGWK